MPDDIERLSLQRVETLYAAGPLSDLRPEATVRIEAMCLAHLKRRPCRLIDRQSALVSALEAILASLLGGSYLLWNLGQALVLYGIRLH